MASEFLRGMGTRWRHVCGVAGSAVKLEASPAVVAAAWLHDIGYADELVQTGMHAIDGARHLELLDAPRPVVSLVAFHTGAEFEAQERDLLNSLHDFDPPDQDDLDLLTLADMTTGPSGESVTFHQRIDGVLERYDSQHPVHRAVVRSKSYLEECCRRASKRTGYPM